MANPTFGEIITTIKGLNNNNKTLEANGVTPKLFKFGGEAGMMFVHECILTTWRSRKTPKDWKRAQIVILSQKRQLGKFG